MIIPFVLITICFAAWGVAANMTDPLVKVFSKIFTMSALQSALVQFAYYGAYFCLALPAAFINRRFSYKVGVLTGLAFAAAGAFLFYPASLAMSYGYFLLALFVLAAGMSILETSANPFVFAMGSEANATQRLNLAQAFNPVGVNLGALLATTLILPHLHVATAEERTAMPPEELQRVMTDELQAVMTPYVGLALVLVALWVAIALVRMPTAHDKPVSGVEEIHFTATLGRLMRNGHYRYGVIAQFFNVGAQTCIWTFTIHYVMEAIAVDEAGAGFYLQYSLIVFLVSRFIMTWLLGFMRPAALLLAMAVLGSALSIYVMASPDISGVWALVAISACLSLMFPTIYGIALHGLGEDAKFGAAGLVMAILGGALMPLLHASLLDAYGVAFSYIVPALCFLVVAAYGVFDLTTKSRFADNPETATA